MATIQELTRRQQELIEQIALLTAANRSAERSIQRLESDIAVGASSNVNRDLARIDAAKKSIENNDVQISRLNSELTLIRQQISRLQQQVGPVQSTGDTVQRDSEGRQESSNNTNPPAPQTEVDADGNIKQPRLPTNATRPSTKATTGTNDPKRTAQSLMGIPATTARDPVPPATGGPQPSQIRGTAAAGDDGAGNATTQRINAIFGGDLGQIITQPNVLDEYSSYTYNVSIYMLTPGQYQDLVKSKKKNLAGFQLLMRSGGAPQAGGSISLPDEIDASDEFGRENVLPELAQANAQAAALGRNQFFPLDYYLDDIRLKSLIQGKGSGGAHNVVSLSFKIFEPHGISLIPNLYKAAEQISRLSGITGKKNYAAQIYLMVIRFYGSDPDGNQVLVKGVRRDENGQPTGQPEVIEKFIPFIFTGIKFRVVQKVTEYDCTAVCPQNFVATSRGRGTIPYNVEITSKTLKDLLAGKVGYSTTRQVTGTEGRQTASSGGQSAAQIDAQLNARYGLSPVGTNIDENFGGLPPGFDPAQYLGASAADPVVVAGNSPTQSKAPPKADAAATPTINQGLFEALNKYQEDLVKKGTITFPDRYEIEIDPILAEAKVVPPGEINKMYTGMNPGQTARDKKDPATNRVDTTTKNTSAVAGMSIVQFIDQYTRTSTYVYDQQIVIFDPNTKKPVRRPYIPGQLVAWYHIGLEATPKRDQWDPKRNDYAYTIKYSLTPYQVNDLKSDYFPQGRDQGAHKSYDFWFTGQNSQVINYEQDFNYLYYLTINNPVPTRTTGTTADYNQYQDEIRRFYQPRSDQSSQGIEGKTNEPSANAADYLYSPADQARVKMTIVGDPAWIQQGELWQGVSGLGYGQAFQSDGTISYDNREVLFLVNFNLPTDYDLSTGLMDVGANNVGRDASRGDPGRARQSYTYRAISVDSMFSRGQFTQELNGVLVLFSLPRGQSTENSGLSAETRSRPGTTPQLDTTARTGALGSTNGVDFSGSEFGAYFGSGETGGAVNYQPRGLSSVLDSQRPQNPLAADSLAAEGFGSEALGLVEVNPPTSSGQAVGAEGLSNTPVPQTPGSAPPITPVTQLTPTQEKLTQLQRELNVAIRRGNRPEIIRLNREIADNEAKLIAEQFARAETRRNQTVKEP